MCADRIPHAVTLARGRLLDDQTRCVHWHGPTDVIAIKFRCCGKYYACHDCHAELETHPAERWAPAQFGEKAVLCGACGSELTISEYLASHFVCPRCGADFNPGCAAHYHLYFQVPAS